MKADDFPIPLRPNRAIELSAAFVHEMAGDRRLDYALPSLAHLDALAAGALAHAAPRHGFALELLMGFYFGEVLLRRAGPARAAWVVPTPAERARHGQFPVHLRLDGAQLCLHAQLHGRLNLPGGPDLLGFGRTLLNEAPPPARLHRPVWRRLGRRLLGAGTARAAAAG